MSLAIHAELESRIRQRAEAEGLTVEAYLEKLVRAEQAGMEELESLALEGLNSGAPKGSRSRILAGETCAPRSAPE